MTGGSIAGVPGWRHLELPSVGSTNAEAMALAATGDPGNLWVTAGEQTAGRGRRGRAWASPPGNLYASALLIDPAPLNRLGTLPLVAAVAVRDAIEACGTPSGTRLAIKWPNDILLNGAKCCGILLESQGLSDGHLAVVIGCGINIVSFPEPGLYRATALNREGISATPSSLFAELAIAFEAALKLWDGGRGVVAIRERWLRHAEGIGGPIAVNLAKGRLEGQFEGIDADGALLLRTSDGTLRQISAGDLFFEISGHGGSGAPGRVQE
ncbi:biotin--[acetyl-CoA-carboxylase] ligase [Oricola thermophila]|uniref:biotin--[acetyl-CoA-carboxylase] ligase n=1 Tax=Oricola thermophila TaxID=2742145 RepID=UPI001FE60079|nr:biotin--[acetyl-CoA-carboxylase] ligase [Oricola thermophila]